MRILVAICVLAVGARAQFGYSGMVNADGVNKQFTPDYARTILLIGPSGVVTSTGENVQFTEEQAARQVAGPPAPMPVAQMVAPKGAYGFSGIVMPDGNNVQFTPDQADNIVLIGPSGVVTKDGKNVQLTEEGVPRTKRQALIGQSGIITPSGKLIQLGHGVKIVIAGPSGAVLSTGENIQYD